MASPLGLPPIAAPLKSITPYLQRAQEVGKQDPIIAYWCAYYAAQLGISLKARDSDSRDVLFALLGTLERMKKEVGPSDVLDIESASSAYVENFALKVFAAADNEDRSGNATRVTAKKFLAAANFMEVLKTFPNTEHSESTLEKIKYAKWKAADIAKAFREGRKPTPGPAGSDTQQDFGFTPPISPPPQADVPTSHLNPPSSPRPPQQTKHSSPPEPLDIQADHDSPPAELQTPPRPDYAKWGGTGEATPGHWSTAATPGTGHGHSDGWNIHDLSSLSEGKRAWVSEELDPENAQYGLPSDPLAKSSGLPSDGSQKLVHFSPSVVGGLSESSIAGSSPPISPPFQFDEIDQDHAKGIWPTAPPAPYEGDARYPYPPQGPAVVDLNTLPPGFVPDPHHVQSDRTITPSPNQGSFYQPLPHIPTSTPTQPPIRQQRYAPQYHPPSPPPPAELTPTLIAKVQKHCRFAISALDYEDPDTARKELRNALALLG